MDGIYTFDKKNLFFKSVYKRQNSVITNSLLFCSPIMTIGPDAGSRYIFYKSVAFLQNESRLMQSVATKAQLCVQFISQCRKQKNERLYVASSISGLSTANAVSQKKIKSTGKRGYITLYGNVSRNDLPILGDFFHLPDLVAQFL